MQLVNPFHCRAFLLWGITETNCVHPLYTQTRETNTSTASADAAIELMRDGGTARFGLLSVAGSPVDYAESLLVPATCSDYLEIVLRLQNHPRLDSTTGPSHSFRRSARFNTA